MSGNEAIRAPSLSEIFAISEIKTITAAVANSFININLIMKYLHTMIRIKNIDESLRFFCEGLGLKETRRIEDDKGRFTLVFLAAPNDKNAEIELTYNWDGDELGDGSRNFGHLAYRVDNIYDTCQRLMDMGYTINRPPRDGHMAFVKSPDKISIEILQEGNLEIKEPWISMKNIGSW